MKKPATAAGGGGIWPLYEAFYIHGMLFCTASAIRSISLLNKNLQKLFEDELEPSGIAARQRMVLDSLQIILNQGAALSRFFWPSRTDSDGVHAARAARLRSASGILDDDSNPLRNRELRNALEHFDEKLDLYLQGHIVGNVIPEYVGPSVEPGGVPTHVFRAFYADIGVFEMLGKRYEVQPIVDEIYRIHEWLVKCEDSGSRFVPPEASA